MFLILGVSPKMVTVDDKPVICPICGLAQARYRRMDQYFNLFFIPLFRVKKGEPFLMCDRCQRQVQEMGTEYADFLEHGEKTCPYCGSGLHPDFRYCPFCGKAV